MITYPIGKRNKTIESLTIQHILQENGYNSNPIRKKQKCKHPNHTEPLPQKKRANFTYVGYEIKAITKILQKAGIQITYTTKHTIGKLLKHHPDDKPNEYTNSGVYQLTCHDCGMLYVGQTVDLFKPVLRNTKETTRRIAKNHCTQNTL
jgi:hypothetical protein